MGKVSRRGERYFISNGREIKKAESRSKDLGAKRHSSSSFPNSTSANRNVSRNINIADHSRNHDGLISPDRIWRQFEIAKSGLNAYGESNSDSSGNTNSKGTSKIDKGKKRISDDADRGSSTRVTSKKTKTGKIDLHPIDISSPAESHGLSNHRSSDEVDDVWSAIDQLPISGPSSNRHLPSSSSSSSSSKPQHNHSSPRLIRQNSVENESIVTAEVIRKIPKFKKSKQNSTEVLPSQNPHSDPSKSTSLFASDKPSAASPEAAGSSSSEFPDSTPNQNQPFNASTESSNLQSTTSTNSVSRSPATTSPQKIKIPSTVLLNLTRRYLDRLYLSQSNCKSSDEKHPVSTANQGSFDRPIVKDESPNRTDNFKTNGIITKPQYKYLCKLIYQKLRTEYACKYGWEATGEGNELEISSDKRSRDSSKSEDGKTSRKSSSVQEKIAEMDNEEFQRVKRKAMAVVEKFVVQETKLDGNVVREGLKKKK
ncbi:hypothetical protein BKA69DRAFT_467388 [Paraphysoderma sedebokerense]|nr:hypothetical protein BKA69DRAFT_467388 [Paraphysoderma sedebokerense]